MQGFFCKISQGGGGGGGELGVLKIKGDSGSRKISELFPGTITYPGNGTVLV